MRVVDDSVVFQWLLEQPSARSREILEGQLNGSEPLVAPELLNYEVGNVLVTKVKLTSQESCADFQIGLNHPRRESDRRLIGVGRDYQ